MFAASLTFYYLAYMKKFLTTILFIFSALAFSYQASCQNIKSPNQGKSIVYFVRPSGLGTLINFKYFDGDNYIGKFSGSNYIIYECEPGDHVFWGASENRDFVTANLLADKTYIIEARPTMGAIKAAVQLIPISKEDEKGMKKINKLLGRKAPLLLDENSVEAEEIKLEFFIKNGLEKYSRDKDNETKILTLLENMYHN